MMAPQIEVKDREELARLGRAMYAYEESMQDERGYPHPETGEEYEKAQELRSRIWKAWMAWDPKNA
jgi:hypothetical protein